ncbi:MAG: autotransporter outer membrane beta-barrel domain-containing protein [Dinoroseobacter sp.]|nr:autotransporter outer membrane beta-barrel domain-containing protein [Dinoroseobacter sp.]
MFLLRFINQDGARVSADGTAFDLDIEEATKLACFFGTCFATNVYRTAFIRNEVGGSITANKVIDIDGMAAASIFNAGTMTGDIDFSKSASKGDDFEFRNSGSYEGNLTFGDERRDLEVFNAEGATFIGNITTVSGEENAVELENAGQFSGSAELVSLENSGTITGNLNILSFGGRFFREHLNTGKIVGDISGDGFNSFSNTGAISGNLAFETGMDFDNTGTLAGSFTITNAASTRSIEFINTGVVEGDVNLAAGDDFFDNSGTIDGSVNLNSGDDTLVWRTGDAAGSETSIEGGAGNDSIIYAVDPQSSLTFTSLADSLSPVTGVSGFEVVGKSGLGTLTFDFNSATNFSSPVVLEGGTLRLLSDFNISDPDGGFIAREDAAIVVNGGTLRLSGDLIDSSSELRRFENLSGGVVEFADPDASRVNVESIPFSVSSDFGVTNAGTINGAVVSRLVTNTGTIEYATDSGSGFSSAVDIELSEPDDTGDLGVINSGTIRAAGTAPQTDAVRYSANSVRDYSGAARLQNEGLIESLTTEGSGAFLENNLMQIENFDDGIIRGERHGIEFRKDSFTSNLFGNDPGTLTILNRDTARIESDRDAIGLFVSGVTFGELDVTQLEIDNKAGATIAGDTDSNDVGYAIQSESNISVFLNNAGTINGDIMMNSTTQQIDQLSLLPYAVEIANTGTIIGNIDTGSSDDLLSNRGSVTGSVDLGDGSDLFVDWVTGNPGTVTSTVSGGSFFDYWAYGVDEGQTFTFTDTSDFDPAGVAGNSFEGIGTFGGGTAVIALAGDPNLSALLRFSADTTRITEDLTIDTGFSLVGEVVGEDITFRNEANIDLGGDIAFSSNGQEFINTAGATVNLQNGAVIQFNRADQQTLLNDGSIVGGITGRFVSRELGPLTVINTGSISTTRDNFPETLDMEQGIDLTNSGTISADSGTFSGATAIVIEQIASTVDNSGTIEGIGTDSVAIDIDEAPIEITNRSGGVIRGVDTAITFDGVDSFGQTPIDVTIDNQSGATITSEGEAIRSLVPGATSFFDQRFRVSISNAQGATIEGDSNSSGDEAAIRITMPERVTLQNSGLISGDVLLEQRRLDSFPTDEVSGVAFVTNTGTIDGDLVTGDNPNVLGQSGFYDLVQNRGIITGDVSLGAGDDFFVWWQTEANGTTNGSIAGILDAGTGEDSILVGVDSNQTVTITELESLTAPTGAPTGFETAGFFGDGTLILDFDGPGTATLNRFEGFGRGTVDIRSDVKMVDDLEMEGDEFNPVLVRTGEGGSIINRATLTLSSADRTSGIQSAADIGLAHEGLFLNDTGGVVQTELVVTDFCTSCPGVDYTAGSLNFGDRGDQTVENRGTINTYIDFTFSAEDFFNRTTTTGDRLINSGTIVWDPDALILSAEAEGVFADSLSAQDRLVEFNDIGSVLNSGSIINRDTSPGVDGTIYFSRSMSPELGFENTSTGLVEAAQGVALLIGGSGQPFRGRDTPSINPTKIRNAGVVRSLDGSAILIEGGDGVDFANSAGGLIEASGPDQYTDEDEAAALWIDDQDGVASERTDIEIQNLGTMVGPLGIYFDEVNEDIVIRNAGRIEGRAAGGADTTNGAAISMFDFDGPGSGANGYLVCSDGSFDSTDGHCYTRITNEAGGQIFADGTAIDYDAEFDRNNFELTIINEAGATITGDQNADEIGLALRVRRDATSSSGVTNVSLTNAGTINGDISLFTGDDTISNSGSINGNLDLSTGDDRIEVFNGAFVRGSLDAGENTGDADLLQVWRDLGGRIGSEARNTGVISDNDLDVVAGTFETIELNAGLGSSALAVEGILDADLIRLQNGELNLNDAIESSGMWQPETWDQIGGGVLRVDAGGVLTGDGLVDNSLTEVLGTLRPGNSIGTISSTGVFEFGNTSNYEIEYRVPDDLSNLSSDGALVGRNVAYDIARFSDCADSGSNCATGLAEQDADLVIATGEIGIASGAAFSPVIDVASGDTAADFETALASSPVGEIRYLVSRSEAGSTERLSGVGLGDIAFSYVNDAGAPVGPGGTWNNLLMVIGGTGPSGYSEPPAATIGTIMRPESVRPDGESGCLPGQVLLFDGRDGDYEACVWVDFVGTRGESFELAEGLDETLEEIQIDLGYERELDWFDQSEARIGLVLGYRDTELRLSDRSGLDDRTTRFGAYLDVRSGKSDFTFSAIYGYHDISQSRQDSQGEQLSGSYNATSLSIQASFTQWSYVDPCWDVGATGSLSWSRVSRDGFTETGGSASGLERFGYDSATGNGLWGRAGLRAKFRGAANGTPTDFNALIGYETLISGGDLDLTGGFINDPTGSRLGVSAYNRFEESAYLAEFDLTTHLSDDVTLRAGLGGRFASAGQDYSASLNLRYEW